jgi:hypothetical protein
MTRFVLAIFIAVALATAAAAAEKFVVPPPVAPKPVEPNVAVQAVSLSRMAANLSPGAEWAERTFGLACLGTLPSLTWDAKNNRIQGSRC